MICWMKMSKPLPSAGTVGKVTRAWTERKRPAAPAFLRIPRTGMRSLARGHFFAASIAPFASPAGWAAPPAAFAAASTAAFAASPAAVTAPVSICRNSL